MSLSDHYHRYQEQFAQERVRLLNAFGELIQGGIVENLEHIGATSVPGLPADPCVDMGLTVWPFPLEPHRRAALDSLGYVPVSGYEEAPEQRFRHSTGSFQLHIVEGGSELWTNYLLIRDYLCSDEDARQRYAAHKQAWASRVASDPVHYQKAQAQLFAQILDAARQWWVNHHGFAPVRAAAHELKEFRSPWHISSGRAIDLFLGRVTRVHQDVDVVVSRTDQLALQQHMTARGWKFVTPFQGRREPWPPHMQLELPRHQAHAHRDGAFIDFLLSDIQYGVWRYRRNPVIVQAAERIYLCTGEGTPFLAPELVLLFKSKNTSGTERPQDQTDFEAICTHLEPERRAWLRWALMVSDPIHPWIDQLA